MYLLKAFFTLIRWKNLLIVYITQLFTWLFVLLPFSKWSNNALFLDVFNFHLLTISTILIAAAGYIINDYFDVKIDLRNKPDKVIIIKKIKKRWAMFWHSIFNIIGFVIACYLAYENDFWTLPFIQFGSTILLWVYSTHLKRMYISGNVVVAFLTALAIWTIAAYESSLYPYWTNEYLISYQVNPIWVVGIYSFFAFMLTWIREVIKDMEDFKGDAEEGCLTMPIKIGLQKSSNFVLLLSAITLIPLVIAVVKLLPSTWWFLGAYIFTCIIAPLIYWMTRVKKKATQKHYGALSSALKLIMMSGIVGLLVLNFLY